MNRDASKYYSHGGLLYGPDMPEGQSVADLDTAFPLSKVRGRAIGTIPGRSAEPPAGAPDTVSSGDAFDDEFPGAEKLRAAGLTTRTQVAALSDEDLDQVPGVGEVTIKEIRRTLKKAER